MPRAAARPVADPRSPEPEHHLTRITYALLLAGAFLVYASANSPVPVAAELRAQIGLTGGDAAVFMLPFALGFGVGCLGWFAFARHRSPRVLIPLALALAATATGVLLMAGTPAVAGGARFFVGMASAGFPAASQAVIAGGAGPRTRGRMIGGFAAAVVSGGVVGQAAIGGLADLISTRWALAIVGVAAPLATALALRATLAPSRPGDGHDGIGPRGVSRLLRDQWPPLALAALLFGPYWLMLSQLTETVRVERFQLSAAEAGLLPILGVLGVITTLGSGWLSDHLGHRLPALATIGLGAVALAFTLAVDTPLWMFAAGFGIFIAAYWGFLAPGSSEVAHRAHARDRQQALMAFYASAWVGAAVFTALGTALAGWTQAAIVTIAAWGVAAVIAGAAFQRHRPIPGSHAGSAP